MSQNQSGEKFTGKVKFFLKDKGYGFITGEDGKEYFVHARSIGNGNVVLPKDSLVNYFLKDGKKGKEACNVTVI
jgi:CspA family cold shock protein